ncbi:MAG: hypothetical protein HRT45_07545 [Bdellovibrionales bacterium]|nr:hypothetical protein [Bdellovibrionales bacterium]
MARVTAASSSGFSYLNSVKSQQVKSFKVVKLITLAFCFLGLSLGYAQDSESEAAGQLESNTGAVAVDAELKAKIEGLVREAAPTPKFKASFDRFYYEFEGVNDASREIGGLTTYGFERVSFNTNVMALSYSIDPLLSVTIQNSYNKIYAETYFFEELYKDETEGFGDTTVKGTKTFMLPSGIYVAEFGAILPTGSITEKNIRGNFNYPYNMQLGSGTQDFMASGTYIKMLGKHQVGGFGMATVRTGVNSEGYRRGDEFMAKTWYSYMLNQYLTPGVWANYHNIQGIVGRDRDFDDPVSDRLLRFYYSPRAFWDVTANVNVQCPITQGLKIKGMLGAPLAQHSFNKDDVQLYTQWFMQAGLEGSF